MAWSSLRRVLLLLVASSPCWGWNKLGHEAVGMTVMSALTPKALTQVKRVLKNRDVVDVSSWGHRLNEKFPSTTPLNYQLQPQRCGKAIDLSVCPNNHCLVRAIQHLYGRLSGKQDNIEMDYPEDLPFTDAEALKLLISLIADLHQPLHVGRESDNGGRALNGTYERNGKTVPTSLHDYWDDVIIDKYSKSRSQYWYGGWTHVNTLGKKTMDKERLYWEGAKDKNVMFAHWATESFELACDKAYVDRTGKKEGDVTQLEDGFHMPLRTEYAVFETVKTQILMAGFRLALVLNTILQARDAVRLRQGGSLISDDTHHDGPIHVEWMRNLLTNLCIFVVVLGIFWYIAKFYSPKNDSPRYRSAKGESDKDF